MKDGGRNSVGWCSEGVLSLVPGTGCRSKTEPRVTCLATGESKADGEFRRDGRSVVVGVNVVCTGTNSDFLEIPLGVAVGIVGYLDLNGLSTFVAGNRVGVGGSVGAIIVVKPILRCGRVGGSGFDRRVGNEVWSISKNWFGE